MRETLEALKAVKADFERNKEDIYFGMESKYIIPAIGICNAVALAGGEAALLTRYFEGWDLFSGDSLFPIGNGRRDYRVPKNLWVGRIGELRLQLLDYLIEQMASDLGDN